MKVFESEYPKGEGRKSDGFYIDATRHRELMKIRKNTRGHDRDAVLIYFGDVGDGKSTIAAQDLKVLDSRFNASCMCQTEDDFKSKIQEFLNMGDEGKHRAIALDEAFEGLNSSQVASRSQKLLVNLLQTIRQRNLFIALVLPNFFDLSKTVAIFRSKWATMVYSRSGERGYFKTWGKERKKELYIRGKALYNFNVVKPNLQGRFSSFMPLDVGAYRKMKDQALLNLMDRHENRRGIMETQSKYSRDNALKELFQKGMSRGDLAKLFKLSKSAVYMILRGER